MHDLDTLRRLNLRASGAVRIVFLTAVLTRAGVQAGYPGGVYGFLRDFPCAREQRGLLTISSMSGGELNDILDAIEARGLDLSTCCAVADFQLGPFDACEGIEFFRASDDVYHPEWTARATNTTDKP